MGACLSGESNASASSSTSSSTSSSAPSITIASNSPRFQALLESAIGKPTDGYDVLFKVLLLGDSAVGKSSIMKRFCFDDFALDVPSTIGVDYMHRFVRVDSHNVVQLDRPADPLTGKLLQSASGGTRVKVQMWDTAGQERFRAVTRNYFKGVHCFVVVFDITARDTFLHVSDFLRSIEEHGVAGVPILLVGNKSDLKHIRVVQEHEAIDFARQHPQIVTYVEVSAKTAAGVNAAVNTMLTRFLGTLKEFKHIG